MNKWGSNHITIKLFCDKDKQKWKRSASSCEEIEMSNIWMFRNAQFSTFHIHNISRIRIKSVKNIEANYIRNILSIGTSDNCT